MSVNENHRIAMSSKTPLVCNYALLRYLPYPETGEFVNQGLVVHCAELGWMELKLETGNVARRVSDFFPALDRAAFLAMREGVAAELERVKQLVNTTEDRALGQRIFLETVRPRESAFRFGEIRTIMTADVAGLAEELFAQYVSQEQEIRPLPRHTAAEATERGVERGGGRVAGSPLTNHIEPDRIR